MSIDASTLKQTIPAAPVTPVGGHTPIDTTSTRTSGPQTSDTDARPNAEQEADAKSAVDELNSSLEPFGVSLKFHRDEESSKIVIEVVDVVTGEQLRQIPDEAALKLAAEFNRLQGRILNRQV